MLHVPMCPPGMPVMTADVSTEYRYHDTQPSHTHAYLWPTVFRMLDQAVARHGDRRAFDLGCGNGAFAAALFARGYDVTGVDPSTTGIQLATAAHPHVRFVQGSTDDDLAGQHGTFPAVVSLEVIEHVYAPRQFAQRLHALVADGGMALISTPYHGYWKNLALAVTGRMDAHFTALWDDGHIKFWSRATLSTLLLEAGFDRPIFFRVGRIPVLAKSMIAVVHKTGR